MVPLTATMKASKQFQTEEKYLTTPRPRILRINSSENTTAKKKFRMFNVFSSSGLSGR